MFLHYCTRKTCLVLIFSVAVAVESVGEEDFATLEWTPAENRSWNDLTIVEARWGAFDGWIDVTDLVRGQVKNGRLSIPDLNVILADVKDPI